jgi:prepilin-type N-terminal cleavage/methylation domain-containing protein
MKTQQTKSRGRGFTLTELLVVICVVAMVAVLLLPGLAASKRKNEKINCVNNLKQIGLASRVWEGDNGDKYPMQLAVTNDTMIELISDGNAFVLWQTMSNVLGTPKNLVCPADKQRTAAVSFTQNFSDANISYFLNLDAADAYPQMIISGDDNIAVNGVRVRPGILNLPTNASVGWTMERHHGAGNLGLSDGSVQTTAINAMQQAFQQTSVATNVTPNWRLVIP